MITLNELLSETGINRNTLAKYRDLGLIPKPEVVHRGYKKEGQPRGNDALYPDYTPWLIREIGRLKSEGYTLSQIRDEIGQIQDITPEEELSEPLQSDSVRDIANTAIAMGRRLDRLTPGYRRVVVEYETSEKDGTLKVVAVWGIGKKLEAKSQ